MLMNKDEMDKRLSSPDNLLNRLRSVGVKDVVVNKVVDIHNSKGTIDIFTGPSPSSEGDDNIFTPPSIDDLIEDADNKIEVGEAHNGALRVRNKAIRMLEDLLPLEQSSTKVSRIASEMSRIASEIRGEVLEAKTANVVPIIFKPMFIEEASFNVIHVND